MNCPCKKYKKRRKKFYDLNEVGVNTYKTRDIFFAEVDYCDPFQGPIYEVIMLNYT